jgi:DNA-directed RNA polymerase specialized sigma24 family protein
VKAHQGQTRELDDWEIKRAVRLGSVHREYEPFQQDGDEQGPRYESLSSADDVSRETPDFSPAEIVELAQNEAKLKQAAQALPLRMQKIYLLMLDSKSDVDIARALNLTLGKVQVGKQEVIASLRKLMLGKIRA